MKIVGTNDNESFYLFSGSEASETYLFVFPLKFLLFPQGFLNFKLWTRFGLLVLCNDDDNKWNGSS